MSIKVIKNEQNPETTEILAESIIKIADGFQSLLSQKFTEEGIVALIHALPGIGIGKPQIRAVLKGLKTLKGYYIRKN